MYIGNARFATELMRSSQSHLRNLCTYTIAQLHDHLVQVLSADIPGETSEAQREKVKKLQVHDARRKMVDKQRRGDIKSGRKAGKAIAWD